MIRNMPITSSGPYARAFKAKKIFIIYVAGNYENKLITKPVKDID